MCMHTCIHRFLGSSLTMNAPFESHESVAARRQAGAELLKIFLSLYAVTKISAMDLCIICYWCERALLLGGAFGLYAFGPGKQSGKYQHHLDRVLPRQEAYVYPEMPQALRGTAARSSRVVPMAPVFEGLNDEIRSRPDIKAMLADTNGEHEGTFLELPVYQQHEQVVRAKQEGRQLPYPFAIYLDGVSYTPPAAGRQDSVLAVTAINLLTNKRHIIGAIRSADCCKCGCLGWCTVFVFLQVVAWMLKAIRRGRRPSIKWDGTPWAADEPLGIPLEFEAEGAFIWTKGDLSEYSKTLGLAS